MNSNNILVGDIGGTKTILAVIVSEDNQKEFKHERRYSSNEYENLEEILKDYVNSLPISIHSSCLAVAGPIKDGQAKITNLPWLIHAEKIADEFNFDSFHLINDLEAIALAIPTLTVNDVVSVHKGVDVIGGTIAVIAPGTGLGEAYLTFENGKYVAHASEGSHASFSPINAEQIQLLKYFQEKGNNHVSFERVCSGAIGIPNLYEFVSHSMDFEEPQWFTEKINKTNDITPLIIESAQNLPDECPICKKVLELFCEILAVETGNLALKILSRGGIYLAGGISGKIVAQLKDPAFIRMLQNKGRFSGLLKQIPIRIITNPKAGLIGAVQYIYNSKKE